MNVDINISFVGEAKKKRITLESMERHYTMLNRQIKDLGSAIDSMRHTVSDAERSVHVAIYDALMEALK